MPSTKIILFNGPPRSGKDTCAQFVMEVLPKAYFYRFASPLKDAVHGLFGMPGILEEHFDAVKGVPSEKFFGMTPREAYIWMSEECAKPKFGKDFFSRVAINHIRSNAKDDEVVVVSDCGFQTEVDKLIEEFGAENVFLVWLLREGTSYQNDSRGYVDHPDDTRSYTINNNGSLSDLRDVVGKIAKEIAA